MSDEIPKVLTEAQASVMVDGLFAHAKRMVLDGRRLDGVPANDHTLEMLCRAMHAAIMVQVLSGMWSELGVTETEQMAGLKVLARFGNQLVGEPPIVVSYDFTHTVLPTIVPGMATL